MNMMQTEVQWFIARDGKQHGPVSDAEMRKLVELGHMRPTDLVWRQGFADWRPAVAVFPPPQQAQQAPKPAPQPAPAPAPMPAQFAPQRTDAPAPHRPADHYAQTQPSQPQRNAKPAAAMESFDSEPAASRWRLKPLLVVLSVIALIGAGLWFILGRGLPPTLTSQSSASRPSQDANAPITAPEPPKEAGKPSIVNPALDARLQPIGTWRIVKRDFPDWYETRMKEAADLAAQGKTDAEVDKHIVGELVKLRRQNSKDALAAPPENLRRMAGMFLENLKALEAYGVAACYAFISRGEVTGVVVEMLQTPGKGEHVNNQLVSIFESMAIGRNAPVKYAPPEKTDYDVLATELGKIGWTQADMQLFANPKSLATAPPSRVCSMVQDWFKAHLSISDAGVQERLLFETLKPVVGG